MTALWRPTADISALTERAALKRRIREWFDQRGFLEVDTPVLVAAPVTDPATENLTLAPGAAPGDVFLATSPEYAMKRLLAAGSGNIYQLGPTFRADERGRYHRPEFTLLEWYRVGQGLTGLMDEAGALLQALGFPPARRVAYSAAFAKVTGLDPLDVDNATLQRCAQDLAKGLTLDEDDRAMLLDVIFGIAVGPTLGQDGVPMLLHGFPLCQAALATQDPHDLRLANRVEIFIHGVEIGNGFEELTQAEVQRARFASDNLVRASRGLAPRAVDERLLAALRAGLPACAGMAIGLERLHMVLHSHHDIRSVMAFADELIVSTAEGPSEGCDR